MRGGGVRCDIIDHGMTMPLLMVDCDSNRQKVGISFFHSRMGPSVSDTLGPDFSNTNEAFSLRRGERNIHLVDKRDAIFSLSLSQSYRNTHWCYWYIGWKYIENVTCVHKVTALEKFNSSQMIFPSRCCALCIRMLCGASRTGGGRALLFDYVLLLPDDINVGKIYRNSDKRSCNGGDRGEDISSILWGDC